MKKLLLFLLIISANIGLGQKQSEKVIVITLDGMRWQEVFGGIDSALLAEKKYTKDSAGLAKQFWHVEIKERRKKLFPFLWGTIAVQGQLLGNRQYGNNVDNANPYKFSYPGYNEIFTGFPDTLVNSNDKRWNLNTNVLEFLNAQPEHKGKVAAFATWDVFPYILNKERSRIYVNADADSLLFPQPELKLINEMQYLTTRPIGVRPDIFTYFAAREYLKAYKPDVLYIAFDETDDFAHAGLYDQYIKAAYAEDRMIADLWNIVQADPAYRGKTTLLITTDHGRGDIRKDDWRHHGQKIKEAGEIWVAALGSGVPAKGEIKQPGQLYQKQVAATIAQLLGKKFVANHPIADAIKF
jgi:hypothetical protein